MREFVTLVTYNSTDSAEFLWQFHIIICFTIPKHCCQVINCFFPRPLIVFILCSKQNSVYVSNELRVYYIITFRLLGINNRVNKSEYAIRFNEYHLPRHFNSAWIRCLNAFKLSFCQCANMNIQIIHE
eukprot:NODE_9_length_47730_cov_0.323718.p29 type:complete len:128 gc:universal NODE_9_length_47730_cov_0.323718:40161-39778(-)